MSDFEIFKIRYDCLGMYIRIVDNDCVSGDIPYRMDCQINQGGKTPPESIRTGKIIGAAPFLSVRMVLLVSGHHMKLLAYDWLADTVDNAEQWETACL